jgi:signal transduction histidine kinase
MIGPERDADDHSIYALYIPARREGREGALIALIDAHEQLEALLLDEALGYQLRVSCCRDKELYRRGTADARVPDAWVREGWIEPSPATLWRVQHQPTAALAADFRTWAVDATLIVGLAMALLIGAVVYEGKKARMRAVAASEAERRVRALNRELETRVEMRTRDLNEVLADLNTINLSVSHDLRSPLNAANLLTYGLRQQNAHDEKTAACLDKITANIKRMAGIMDRLLGFSRVSSFEYRIEQVDMRGLAGQVVHEQASEPGSQAQITIGDLPPADADRTMIHILFTNLLGNALNHAKNGGVQKIEIGFEERDREGVYFVADNGPGFDEGKADELFKPAHRLRESSEKGGLGLGLAISARIVERHGGRIWAESGANEGARFLFTLHASRTTQIRVER